MFLNAEHADAARKIRRRLAFERWNAKNPGAAVERARKWTEANRERSRASRRAAWKKLRKENPVRALALVRSKEAFRSPEKRAAKWAKWYAKNQEHVKKSREANRPIHAERQRLRNARRSHATPSWADRDAIRAIYVAAAAITKQQGVRHHVDHIVPLKSRLVCGLHVEHNLQILSASANAKKSNRVWPDMP